MAPKFNLNSSVSVNSIECRSSDQKFNLCASQAKRKQKLGGGATIKSALFHSNCVRAATQFRPGGTAICQLSNFDSKTILKFVGYFLAENFIQVFF